MGGWVITDKKSKFICQVQQIEIYLNPTQKSEVVSVIYCKKMNRVEWFLYTDRITYSLQSGFINAYL